MSPTHSSATRRTGLRVRSALCLLAMLAAVSACSDSGGTGEEQQPKPISQVAPGASVPAASVPEASVPEKSAPGGGQTGRGQDEPDENEPDENEGGGNEP